MELYIAEIGFNVMKRGQYLKGVNHRLIKIFRAAGDLEADGVAWVLAEKYLAKKYGEDAIIGNFYQDKVCLVRELSRLRLIFSWKKLKSELWEEELWKLAEKFSDDNDILDKILNELKERRSNSQKQKELV